MDKEIEKLDKKLSMKKFDTLIRTHSKRSKKIKTVTFKKTGFGKLE